LLVGQPELQAKLDLPDLRQLSQRIAMRCTIPPLTRTGTRNYIRSRLRGAGARDVGLFTDAALARIAEYAQGIPRIVNTICDHSLLIGYADQTRRIDREIVDEAIQYLEAGRQPRRRRTARSSRISRGRWAGVGVLAGVVAGVATLAILEFATLSQAVRTTTSYASELAQTLRALLGR
jgi:hypothetical protein